MKPYVVFVPYPTRNHGAPRKRICAKKDPFITKPCVRLRHNLTLTFAQIKYSYAVRQYRKQKRAKGEIAMLILGEGQRRHLEAS